MTTPYRILGLDPGTNYMGYGVLEVNDKSLVPIVLGDIDLHKIADPYDKLRYIFERVRALITEYSPRETYRVCLNSAAHKVWLWLPH